MGGLKGPSLYRVSRNHKKEVELMGKIMRGETVHQRKKRAKETVPRQQPERLLRAEVIRWFKKKGYYYKRIENGVCGKLGKGVPDLLFFRPSYRNPHYYPQYFFYWLELKSDRGALSFEQKEFRQYCEESGTKYIVARSIEDIEKAL